MRPGGTADRQEDLGRFRCWVRGSGKALSIQDECCRGIPPVGAWRMYWNVQDCSKGDSQEAAFKISVRRSDDFRSIGKENGEKYTTFRDT